MATNRNIGHVVVLGANGAMGYGSAALFTTAVDKVTMLARTEEKAKEGLEAAIKQVRSGTVADRVEVGSYDEDFQSAVESADLIFEAVTEDLALKHEYFERVDKTRRDDAIVATVTSGLSINELAEPRSDSFKQHFLGLHFFNPPNVIVGTELIAGEQTDPAVADFVDEFSSKRLGRVMIRAADRPGFAGNRVGFKVLNEVAQLAEEHGPLYIEKVFGPYTGRALTALGTIDLVGWDIHKAIVDNVHANAPDEVHDTLKIPAYMDALIAKGVLGNKTGGGFFKKDGKTRLVLDPKTGDYTPEADIQLPQLDYIEDVARLHAIADYEGAMEVFMAAEGKDAALARKILMGYISYAFHRVGEVAADITAIDLIMGYGFNWAPPSVLVDTIGLDVVVEQMEASDIPVPPILTDAQKAGRKEKWFALPGGNPGKYFVAG